MTKGGKEALILYHLRFLHLEYYHLAPFFCSYFFFPFIFDVTTRFALPETITPFLLSSFLPPLYVNPTSCFDHFQHHKFLRSLTLRLLMSYIYIYIYIYIYGAPILNVSRSHTTTQHSR